jgi:DNA-binding MarR family transcriptional regulator
VSFVADRTFYPSTIAGGTYAVGMEDPIWLSEGEQRQWRTLLGTVRLFNRALERQMLRDAGLPHAYYGILVTLAEAPDRCLRMGDLAATLDFSPSRLSHAVARMEEAGWVQRRVRPSSGRERDAQLTDEGFEVLARAAPGHVALVRDLLFDRFDAGELEGIRLLCERLAPALEEIAGCSKEGAGLDVACPDSACPDTVCPDAECDAVVTPDMALTVPEGPR